MCLLERKASKNILRKLQWWFLTNKIFWSIVKIRVISKGKKKILKSVSLIITDSLVLTDMINSHYINIVEKLLGKDQAILLVTIKFLKLYKLKN